MFKIATMIMINSLCSNQPRLKIRNYCFKRKNKSWQSVSAQETTLSLQNTCSLTLDTNPSIHKGNCAIEMLSPMSQCRWLETIVSREGINSWQSLSAQESTLCLQNYCTLTLDANLSIHKGSCVKWRNTPLNPCCKRSLVPVYPEIVISKDWKHALWFLSKPSLLI